MTKTTKDVANCKKITSQKQKIISIVICLIIMTLTSLTIMTIFNTLGGVDNFKDSCESFGGSFWEIANVTCAVGSPNCRYMCALNDERFSMSDL